MTQEQIEKFVDEAQDLTQAEIDDFNGSDYEVQLEVVGTPVTTSTVNMPNFHTAGAAATEEDVDAMIVYYNTLTGTVSKPAKNPGGSPNG